MTQGRDGSAVEIPAGPIKVLLVEDNPSDARFVEETLRDATALSKSGSATFDVAWVSTVAAGLRHLSERPTDVAILDLALPDADGLEALVTVRAHAPGVPVVVVTGQDDEELAMRAVREGAQDFYLKGSVEGAILARAIRYALERGREHAAQEQLLARQQAAVAEAAAVTRVQSEFLALVSHEMRTPLNAIIGYAQLLLDFGLAGPLSIDQTSYIRSMNMNGQHLLSLITDLLDLSHLDAHTFTVDVGTALASEATQRVAAQIEPDALAKRVTLVQSPGDGTPLLYRGDRDRVHQILTTMMRNAVQFTGAGRRITIASTRAERSTPESPHLPAGSWALITVEDTGSGIPVGQLKGIFEPFVQGKTGYTRTHNGLGLGLAIGRRLARLMGGDLTVRSTEGMGSTFALWLPVAA